MTLRQRRPLTQPVAGTYWRTELEYDKMQPKAPKFVAVVKTTRGYARMGMQECFVEFDSAVNYATKKKHPKLHRLDHEVFMRIFKKVSDEDLGHELGLEILAHYDD